MPKDNAADPDARSEALNARFRKLLKELQASLSRTLADSDEVSDALRRIRDEGWSLYLVVDRQKERRRTLELTAPAALPECEPVFKIDGHDLSFLRSVGIDPTRKLKRRRSG